MKDTTINIEETIQEINKQNKRIEELCLEIEKLNNIIKEAIEYLKVYGWYDDDNGRIYGDLNDDECTELLDILNKGE